MRAHIPQFADRLNQSEQAAQRAPGSELALDVRLLGDLKRVFYLDAEVASRAESET